ncbi:Acetyltransferase (GNAT) family protein [Devosia lucknowensis]|uniref:Acetyltransferase (GNAT) family protein n=1 Tax=Devosia lucknowensis TaxID=1096929 RepID=A0A1Y6F9W4_9HYPH|nr:GNAT family N-acetyltransferase [Devosia lucknowensis]SMQ70361.1 Acetyltransferase (GNAT) family protein [Devosia lucknowensis]
MITYRVDPHPDAAELDAFWRRAWGSAPPERYGQVLSRSLGHLGAFDGKRLIGFVNVAWDGGVHAFILDTGVDPDFRRRGIATDLVRRAADIARLGGAHWLHVDFEPHLAPFYRACGFRPTEAGLMSLVG